MKKIILSTIFVFSIAGFASAQTTGNKNSNSSKSHKIAKARKAKIKKALGAKTVELDTRKEYIKDGQKATATGHEATPTNSEQFQSAKDSANKKRKRQ
jgi:hypothetical protein